MVRLSPCIEMFWRDVAFPDRIQRAASLGFNAYEFWGYDSKDLDAIERATKETGLALSACCVNMSLAGGTISMLQPEGSGLFADAVKDCLAVQGRLGCKSFIVTTGQELDGVPRSQQHHACVASLKAGAPIAEDAGITLVLEPLNLLVNHKGYYLSTSAEGFGIVDEVGSPAVKLLFDVYHQQITEGNLSLNIRDNIDKIGHFHVANHPGRHELWTGEIDYNHILALIDGTDYAGYVGLEFSPSDPEQADAILTRTLEMAP